MKIFFELFKKKFHKLEKIPKNMNFFFFELFKKKFINSEKLQEI